MLVIWRSLILSRIIYGTRTVTIRSELRNNYRFDEGMLYYKKKTDTSLMLYDSSFNGHLSHELQVQIVNIYRLAIKDKKIMVTALPVQQQTAGTLTCGVYNCCCFNLPFSRGDSSFIFVHLYCTCLQPEWIIWHLYSS